MRARHRARRRIALLLLPGATLLALAGLTSFLWVPLLGGGPWKVEFDGYGTVRVTDDLVALAPQAPATQDASDTHAALVLSKERYAGDLTVTADLLTTEQLRPGGANPWEVGWLLWHVQDWQHFYAIALKPNGWELSKQVPGQPGGQQFLASGEHPFPVGEWHTVRVTQDGGRITVSANGHLLTRYTDPRPYLDGAVGLYTEDAAAVFRNVDVTADGV